jgi:internalin A
MAKSRKRLSAGATGRIDKARRSGAISLNLLRMKWTELPESVGQLTQLEHLDLSGTLLTALPESIGQLTRLKELYLGGSRLTALPESIGQLTQLEHLDLSDTRLTALPESFGQLTRLKELYLGGTRLTALPESFGQLTQLQELALGGTRLTALPESIGHLTQLQKLYLGGTQLTALPESFGQLTQLQELYLSDVELTALPESIGQFTQLERLDLSGMLLAALPESLRRLTKLARLLLHDNPALELPAEVLGPTLGEILSESKKPVPPREILEYYFRTRGGKRPLNEAKLILVGRGEVGKTSIVNLLIHNSFDPNQKKTEGIKIDPWELSLAGEQVRLNVWDFGGQEIMHATHQFFLTQRSLYLLVLSGRGDSAEDDADYWLKLIGSFGGTSPVIVVLNKIKAHRFDVNRRAARKIPVNQGSSRDRLRGWNRLR